MRLLHTADWHAGRSLLQTDLNAGLWSALDEMLSFAVTQKVDAVLVTGDLFDSHRPDARSQERVYEFFLRLHKADIPAVVLAGNHDSMGHWGALRPLFRLAGVTIVPQLALDAVHTVPTRSGPLEVAVLPWPTERVLVPLIGPAGKLDAEQRQLEWARRVKQFLEALAGKLGRTGHRVLAGHLHVDNTALSDTERATGSYSIPKDVLPPDLDYIALGHLHRPQEVSMAAAPTWYCGAPRCMSFDEGEQGRGFLRVDLRANTRAEVELVPVAASLPLRQLQFPLERLEELAGEYTGFTGYLRAVVEVTQLEVGLKDRVRGVLGERVLDVREHKSAETVAVRAPRATYDLSDPRKTFREFFQERFPKKALTDSLMAAFNELLEAADDQDAPAAPKPKRGRPAGSKNKPKVVS